jgi:hypothetical protein
MRYATINNGVVTNVITGPAPGSVPLADGVLCAPGWLYDGETFMPASFDATLDELKSQKIAAIKSTANKKLDALINEYPEAERHLWAQLESEAREVLADPAYPNAAVLSQFAQESGATISNYAGTVVAKADALRAATALLVGWRRRNIGAIQAIEDAEALSQFIPDAIPYE